MLTITTTIAGLLALNPSILAQSQMYGDDGYYNRDSS